MQQFYFRQFLTLPGYAFFMESSSIEYIMERDCGLTKVGGELDSKSYGIGMRKNYPYKEQINNAILKLQENGFMHKLKTKWWKQKGAKNCKVRKLESTASKLNSIFLGFEGSCIISSQGFNCRECCWSLPCSDCWSHHGFCNCAARVSLGLQEHLQK